MQKAKYVLELQCYIKSSSGNGVIIEQRDKREINSKTFAIPILTAI